MKKGKLENLSVKEYNEDILKPSTFEYINTHELQGKVIVIAPFFAELETDEGLIMPDEEEYMDPETFKNKVRQSESKAIVEKGVIVKISSFLREEMESKAIPFDLKEGDVIYFENRNSTEYKIDRTTMSYEEADHFLLKINVHQVEAVVKQ